MKAMGIAVLLGIPLYFSIVFIHELGHVWNANRHGANATIEWLQKPTSLQNIYYSNILGFNLAQTRSSNYNYNHSFDYWWDCVWSFGKDKICEMVK